MYGGGGIVGLTVLIQLLYPSDRLLPNVSIDGLAVGGWQKADATWEIDHRYLKKNVAIYFGGNKMAYRTPVTGEIGLTVSNGERIEHMNYPWWLRLVPSSILWAHTMNKDAAPDYQSNEQALTQYVDKELGKSCNVAPKDADITFKDDALQVVASAPGGTCEISDVKKSLADIKPALDADASIRVPMKEIPAAVTTADAQQLIDDMKQRAGENVTLKVGDETVNLPTKTVFSWMDFAVIDGALRPQMNAQRAGDYLAKNVTPKVSKAAGVSKVTTRDFVEVARVDGANGQTLNVAETLDTLLGYLTKQRDDAVAMTAIVPPRIEYTRTYSPTDEGLNALLANYAKDNKGTFGISLVELSGERRRAHYNEDKTFVTASTYKLFVAYSTLKRVEAGTWNWNDVDIATGRNLATCFDDMIVKSDNACAEALLRKVGFRTITDEMRDLGLENTSFLSGDSPTTTSGDLAVFLATLESGQMFSSASQDRLLSAMKRNIFRQGIPAGVNGTVANKVGFLNALLHDASVVYSPNGKYVLVIMTDGSSWGAIAELTRQIEALRAK